MATLRTIIRSVTGSAAPDRRRKSKAKTIRFPVEFSDNEKSIVSYVIENRLSMTSPERLFTTVMACKHAIERNIEGDFVECGVWRGGNAMLAAAIFKMHECSKRVCLFDTFQGMTEPSDEDTAVRDGSSARETYVRQKKDTHNEWCYASLEDVRNNFARADLLGENIVFVKGDVLRTLDDVQSLPQKISVLRLDTDWYESTRKELEVLYPRLSIGGVLIIDDYGHWAGSKKATDEYFAVNDRRPFLQYTDDAGRVGVKFDQASSRAPDPPVSSD